MNNLLSRARASLRLTLLSKGKEVQNLSIDSIPERWEEFGTKGDRWINVEFPESENSSGCIYIGQKDSVFDPHIHKNSVEHLTVLNIEGEMEIITDTWSKVIKYPDSAVIDKGVPHAVIFKNTTKLLIMWHPKFEKGWNADFLD